MASIKYKTEDGYVSIPMSIEAKTNEENGNGIGVCSTSSGTALTVSLTGYELVQNGIVAVTFANDVPANATLNINNKGAKPIYYKGAAIEADVIKADDTVTFGYDGTNYVVTSLGGESGGSAAGLEIVAASGTTLTAEVGKYYRYDSEVSSLTVTLPSTVGMTFSQEFKLYFTTGTNINLSLSSTDNIHYIKDFSIEEKETYEATIIWNGSSWIVSLIIIEVLPTGAKKIEYLQSSGTQYIDTGYTNSSENSKIVIKQLSLEFSGTYHALRSYGAVGTAPGRVSRSGFPYINTNPIYFAAGDGDINMEISNTENVIREYIFTANNGTATVSVGSDFATKTYSGSLMTGSSNYVFACNQSGPNGMVKIRLYYLKIYDNDNLVRFFIPIRIGQVGYLYDKITKQTFANLGTGDFILGPDI